MSNIKIYIDADAAPKQVKEILFRAAQRTGIELFVVADQPIYTPTAKNIHLRVVPKGIDAVDKYIVELVLEDDLVITADIPLAAEVIEKKAYALNPRGELYTKVNIKQRLTMRNFMSTMRDAGENIGGPAPITQKDIREFANSLDSFIAKATKS